MPDAKYVILGMEKVANFAIWLYVVHKCAHQSCQLGHLVQRFSLNKINYIAD